MVKCDPVMRLSPKTPEFDFGDGLRGSMRARVRRGACARVQACPCVRPRVCARACACPRVCACACVPACVRVRALIFILLGGGLKTTGLS